MKDKDKEEFVNWYKNKESEFDNCKEAFQAACEYKDKQINSLEVEKQKLFVKLSKELEAEKAKVSKLKEENEKLKECIRFYAAGDTQFDCEYVDVQGGLVFKSGSYARQLLKKL
jgi:hypothetical protein